MALIIENEGDLQKGILHSCSGDEFIKTFCADEYRNQFKGNIINIFDYAKEKGADRIIVGGSFIADVIEPQDFDCVIVFKKESDIPQYIDSTVVGEVAFDILFTSEDNPRVLDAFIDLFQHDKNGTKSKAVVEVLLDSKIQEWTPIFPVSTGTREILCRLYSRRTIIERRKCRGLLFTIHGVNTKAIWNSRFSPLACSQGWIYAPFIYESPKTLLICHRQRVKVLNEFAKYFQEISEKYQVRNASIVAHSFGTYIVAEYLQDVAVSSYLPINIDSIVLTGCIVNKNYDWTRFYPDKVGRILNLSSKGDKWVKKMPSKKFILYKIMKERDGIFGNIGYSGIEVSQTDPDFIKNDEVSYLTHTNTFEPRTLENKIMPFLNANVGITLRQG